MGRHLFKKEVKGSQLDIQKLVENNPDLLALNIKISFELPDDLKIEWVSPLRRDDFAEYSDDDFLEKLGKANENIRITDFWPKGGPHWDALGKASDGSVFLIEAKAHISEMVSTPSQAGEDPLKIIRFKLERTKQFIHARADVDWTLHFFQYANRLAHLHFLRFDKKLPVFLVFIYFIGDKTVLGPQTKEEWLGALELLRSFLGIGRTKLTPFMTDVFIHIDEIPLNP